MEIAGAWRLPPYLPRLENAKITEQLTIRFVPLFNHDRSVIATPRNDKVRVRKFFRCIENY